MKGLLLNNFYSAIGNIKLFMIIIVIMATVVLGTGNPTAQELFVYITVTAFSINAVVNSRKDAVSNWNKFEITLPVCRKDIIRSKYISYIFLVFIGALFALVITLITMLIHRNSNLLYGMSNFFSMFTLGIGISLFTGALFYPIAYMVGIEKSETVLIISVLAAIGLAVFVINILNQFIFIFSIRMIIFVCFYLFMFALSYILTLCLYRKKEF